MTHTGGKKNSAGFSVVLDLGVLCINTMPGCSS
jgi:hypothetical protein